MIKAIIQVLLGRKILPKDDTIQFINTVGHKLKAQNTEISILRQMILRNKAGKELELPEEFLRKTHKLTSELNGAYENYDEASNDKDAIKIKMALEI